MRTRLSFFFFFTSAVVASANSGLNGNFIYRGGDCQPEPVTISQSRLNMGHVQCTFSSRVAVRRMTAELRDATCYLEEEPVETRYFIARTPDGLMLFSPELGMELLDDCP